MRVVFAFILCLVLVGCATGYRDRGTAITSMAVFDPERYAGRWYEIAAFPTPFQRGCTNTQAEYGLLADGRLSVRNTCQRNGGTSFIEGAAALVGPGRLSVRLDGVPFAADYWVLWVDEGYRTAVVGTPSGRAGWILNRDPQIPADRLKAAEDVLAFNGYDTTQLVATPQGVAP